MSEIAEVLSNWMVQAQRRQRARWSVRRAFKQMRAPRRQYGPWWYEFLIWASRNA